MECQLKNERVYSLLQNHMPYFLEKRVGGYSIVSKETGIKENHLQKICLRLEQLENVGSRILKIRR